VKNIFTITLTIAAINAAIITPKLFQDTPVPPTPSPAPTKTTTTTTTPEIIATESNDSTSEDTLTQNDLTVITGNVQRPNGALWFENKLYIVCSGDWTIYAMDDTTGETQTYIYGVRNSHTIYAEKDKDDELTLWAPDINTGQLLKINQEKAPEPIVKNLDSPWGIAYLDDTKFLITSQNGDNINVVSRDGTVTKIAEGLRSPTGIIVDAENETAYVANSGSARRAIEWFDTSALTGEAITIPSLQMMPLVSGLQNTTDVTLGSDGMLYFAYALGTRGVVGRVDPQKCKDQGGCTNDEVEIVVYTELTAPLAGLTISPDMTLFIHTMFRPEIYRVELK
jgi:hypothetical protein